MIKYKFTLIGVLILQALSFNGQSVESLANDPMESIYQLSIEKLGSDEIIDLEQFRGKKVLFVNVASKCGYTPQYKGLQELYEEYGEEVEIIGLPCNQFKSQEPGSAEEIADFCETNFGITFLLTSKIDVKGENQHPIYQWLTQRSKNGKMDSEVKWNFNKYLIDEEGRLIVHFGSGVRPMSNKIISLL